MERKKKTFLLLKKEASIAHSSNPLFDPFLHIYVKKKSISISGFRSITQLMWSRYILRQLLDHLNNRIHF